MRVQQAMLAINVEARMKTNIILRSFEVPYNIFIQTCFRNLEENIVGNYFFTHRVHVAIW